MLILSFLSKFGLCLIIKLLKTFLSFPDGLEMGQLFVLLLLFDKFGFEVLGGDSLGILTFLLDFNITHCLPFIIFHIPLLFQIEFVQKLLILETCLNRFKVFRVLCRTAGCHDKFFTLFELCLFFDLLLSSLLSKLLMHLHLLMLSQFFLSISDIILHLDLHLMVLFLHLSELSNSEDLGFMAGQSFTHSQLVLVLWHFSGILWD